MIQPSFRVPRAPAPSKHPIFLLETRGQRPFRLAIDIGAIKASAIPAALIGVHQRVEDHAVPEPRGNLAQMKGGRDPVEEAQFIVIGLVVRQDFIVIDGPLPLFLALAGEVDGQLPEDGQSGVGGGVDGDLAGEDGAHAQREEAGDGGGHGEGKEAA